MLTILKNVKYMADIIDTAVSAGFNTVVAAVMAVNLVDTLKGPGSFTVFAAIDNESDLPAGRAES